MHRWTHQAHDFGFVRHCGMVAVASAVWLLVICLFG